MHPEEGQRSFGLEGHYISDSESGIHGINRRLYNGYFDIKR